jgi:hypothetical protein
MNNHQANLYGLSPGVRRGRTSYRLTLRNCFPQHSSINSQPPLASTDQSYTIQIVAQFGESLHRQRTRCLAFLAVPENCLHPPACLMSLWQPVFFSKGTQRVCAQIHSWKEVDR